MMNYYQPFLFPFLGKSSHKTTKDVMSTYYLSFEDCLWNLLASKKIKKGSCILFPNFYCIDVVNNTKLHGYQVAFYEVDKNFQTTKKNLLSSIEKNHSSVVMLFHACGITSTLTESPEFIKQLSKTNLVIEDSVHRLVNPKKVHVYSENHVILDSLRKVLPLPGSFVYGNKKTILALGKMKISSEYSYMFKTFMYFMFFKFFLFVGFITKTSKIITYTHKSLLKLHDDLIGDSKHGHFGLPFIPFIHQYINFNKVEMIKHKQVSLYMQTLKTLKLTSPWYFVRISPKDYKNLHVFPLGISSSNPIILKKIENLLQQNNMSIWFKFTDSPWNNGKSVLFLPLGFHITDSDIIKVCHLLNSMKLT